MVCNQRAFPSPPYLSSIRRPLSVRWHPRICDGRCDSEPEVIVLTRAAQEYLPTHPVLRDVEASSIALLAREEDICVPKLKGGRFGVLGCGPLRLLTFAGEHRLDTEPDVLLNHLHATTHRRTGGTDGGEVRQDAAGVAALNARPGLGGL